MYIYIQEYELKKTSLGTPKEIFVGKTTRIIDGEKREVYGHGYSEERFERPIKKAYKVMAAHSYRDDGKVRKKTALLGTFRYYDVLDGYFFECWNVAEKLNQKGIPFDNEDDVIQMVYDKVTPIENANLEALKSTEEYKTIQYINNLHERDIEHCKEFEKKYGFAMHDCFFDIFGELREPEAFEEFKITAARKKREQEEYARKSYENSQSYYSNFGGYDNYNSFKSLSNGNFSSEENEMIRALIASGFKQMSKKLHPDLGGDENKMKLLNNIKDKLDSIYGK